MGSVVIISIKMKKNTKRAIEAKPTEKTSKMATDQSIKRLCESRNSKSQRGAWKQHFKSSQSDVRLGTGCKTVQNNDQKGRWGDVVSQERKSQSDQPWEKSWGKNKCSLAFYNDEPEMIKEEY